MESGHHRWRPLYRLAALSAGFTVLTIPAQAVIFAIHQPPEGVVDWFELYNSNPALGLLNLDLLYAASQVFMVPMLLGVGVSLWTHRPALALAGVGVMLFAIVVHTTSNPSVEMLSAARQYAAASTETERTMSEAAGQTLLYRWSGTSYVLGYMLAGLGLIVLSAAMWNSPSYGRVATGSGIVLGAFWLVPASFGTVGLFVSFLSLVPTLIWLSTVGWKLWRLGMDPSLSHQENAGG